MNAVEKYKVSFESDDSNRYYFYNYYESIMCSKEMYDEWFSIGKPNWYCINRKLYKNEEEFIRLYNLKVFW